MKPHGPHPVGFRNPCYLAKSAARLLAVAGLLSLAVMNSAAWNTQAISRLEV